jgi:RNA polymerase sigma-70 factor (ECF subfamily)
MGPENGLMFDASNSTSSSLIRAVRTGDASAWQRLVSGYSPLVYAWCLRSEMSAGDAADVMQEVFLAVWRGLSGFRREEAGQTFRGWLRVITRNKITDHFRREATLPRAVGGGSALDQQLDIRVAESTSSYEVGPMQSLLNQALADIRAEFEPPTWQAFLLTALQGRSPAETAVELQMSPGGVRQAKYKVLRRLRQELGDAER